MKILRYIFLLSLLGCMLHGSAKIYPKTEFIIPGASLLSSPVNSVTTMPGINNTILSQLNNSNRHTSVQNTIELVLKNNFNFTENVKVTLTGSVTYSSIYPYLTDVTKPLSLQIDFHKGAATKSDISNIFSFKDAYTVNITISNVTVVSDATDMTALNASLANFLELKIGYQEERFTRINYTQIPINLNFCQDQTTDELVISWDPLADAEEYQLEYSFIDDYTDVYNTPVNPSLIPFNFKNNSTRVSLKTTNYRFPLLYERGWIVYRLRAVGRGGGNLELPVYCRWSGNMESGMVSAYFYKFYHAIPHNQDNMNWQVASTFAEEGKRSDIVNYFDGTFRSRQTVTGMNIERPLPYGQFNVFGTQGATCAQPGDSKMREVIAGETIYDYQGRPSVNILPAPTNSRKIEYLPLLNISNSINAPETTRKPYNWQDFDAPNYTCPNTHKLFPMPDANNGIMGAAAYYSPNNPNKLGFNAFIPDAFGYPFTQISYLQDNTGRVSAQTGVGEIFHFGNNHETRFYYAAPNQEELDRMFGIEVGVALRYQKNAVMDPNGQVSVTYLNPEGKTIATALAGKTPTNLDPLENQDTNTIEISLMDKNIVNVDDKTMIIEHAFMVTSDNTTYQFDYSLIPESLTATVCPKKPVCLDCIYDIEITLRHNESCSNIPLDSFTGTIGQLITYTRNNFQGNNGNVSSGGNTGRVQVSRRPDSTGSVDLNCNNSASTPNCQQQILRNLNIGTYIITKKITVNQQAAQAYIDEVFKDTCKTKWNEFLNDELSQIDTMDCYSSCLNCAEPPLPTPSCDTAYCHPAPNRCDVIHEMMLADISPGGQYAQFERHSDGTIDASAYPLSIFNINNILPIRLIDWSLLPPILNGDLNALANNWLPEFATALLPMHPEYCLYGWCNSLNMDLSLDFDVKILSTQYYQDAVTKNFINIGNTTPQYMQLLNGDQWFAGGANANYYTLLQNKLSQYPCNSSMSADQLAMHMAFCAYNNPTPTPPGTPVMGSGPTCTLQPLNYLSTHVFGSGDARLNDLEWTFLRALYLSAKNEVLKTSMFAYAITNTCNARCIGSEHYYNWTAFMSGSSQQYFPCHLPNNFGWILYKDKQSRFSTDIDNILNEMEDAGIAVDLSGVTDPDDICMISQVIASQGGNINQQMETNICGGSDTTCIVGDSLLMVINSIIAQLYDTNNVVLSASQLPASMLNAGIMNVHGNLHNGFIQIDFNQSSTSFCTFNIPCYRTNNGCLTPLFVCCISNISCGGITCNFDMQVVYSNGERTTIHLIEKCNLLTPCVNTVVTPVCNQQSIYIKAIKNYLNDILNFKIANTSYPSAVQLKTLLPGVLLSNNGGAIGSVSLNSTTNFLLSISYAGVGQADNKCSITLQNNSSIGNWSNVKNILSIRPDYSFTQNGFTKHFILRALVGNDPSTLTVVNILGSASCWVMNQCSPTSTLCDSITPMPSAPYANDCVRNMMATVLMNTSIRYQNWEDSMRNQLLIQYNAKCLSALETMKMKYVDKQYHYTLYYYDQAGNLVKTIPPAGVQLLNHTGAMQAKASRDAGYNVPILPTHIKRTLYRYNSLNELVWQKTPDADESNFFYDGLGRIVASQNKQQHDDGNYYSYTKFDILGRMVESGKLNSSAINATFCRNFDGWTNFINNLTGNNRTEITLTRYDETTTTISQKFGAGGQRNLRKRVASVFSFADASTLIANNYIHASHYRYDIEGNVDKLIQDYPNNIIGDKSIDYEFDLQSGKVNKVTYQKNHADQFIHKYKYDAANRLTQVKTSTNGIIWEMDAEYKYYRHGPLARVELGTDKVQGLDYMYTIQGWIKAVNGTADTAINDMGQDGITDPSLNTFVTIDGITYSLFQLNQLFGIYNNGPGYGAMNNPIAKDAFGYVLEYFGTDYNAIQGNHCLDGMMQTSGTVKPLYNGNISRMYTQIQTLGNNGYNYTYDQLNRITTQNAWKINSNTMAMLPGDEYKGTFKYDADGNILQQMRNGNAPNIAMDNLKYWYYDLSNNVFDPTQGIPNNATNKLAYVEDPISLSGNYPVEDIDNQPTNNYTYNKIGNLIGDAAENITLITWNLQNKIKAISKSTGPSLSFEYDAFGNRVMKNVTGGSDIQNGKTFYVRDAQGNSMATYTYKTLTGETAPKLFFSEAHIYGSSRIGLYTPGIEIQVLSSNTPNAMVDVYYTGNRGYKQYELSNHLGNVLATISDRKIPLFATAGITYAADLISGQDYYAFGMLMPGRKTVTKFRYGFNGKENDNEVKGDGDQQDYGFRIYDPRLGRFLSIDPLTSEYPWYTPFQFAGNKPIQFIDLDGTEEEITNNTHGEGNYNIVPQENNVPKQNNVQKQNNVPKQKEIAEDPKKIDFYTPIINNPKDGVNQFTTNIDIHPAVVAINHGKQPVSNIELIKTINESLGNLSTLSGIDINIADVPVFDAVTLSVDVYVIMITPEGSEPNKKAKIEFAQDGTIIAISYYVPLAGAAITIGTALNEVAHSQEMYKSISKNLHRKANSTKAYKDWKAAVDYDQAHGLRNYKGNGEFRKGHN